MAVEVGWSRDPNAKWQWPGGPVTGMIAPDREHIIRLVAATPAAGPASRARCRRTTSISNNHRLYAVQWFLFALIALVIYVLALRKRAPRQAACLTRRCASLQTLVAEPWDDWALIDCGDGRKYERYGNIRVVRPEPQAMWAPASDDWDPDATFVPGSDEEGGGRWVQHRPVPRRMAALARRRALQRFADPVPPPRLLSRHGAAMGLDARARRRRRDPQPVRLHRRRHPAAERSRRADGPCRCVEEVGRGRQGQCRAVGPRRAADPLDGRRCEQVHRARGAPRAPL